MSGVQVDYYEGPEHVFDGGKEGVKEKEEGRPVERNLT